ncbi:hypothetical protein JRQ81_019399 [Phrynocephalus forsythii]|uniref:Uncharacterized protein n=1 Tax=Phrynocephalus forsythii TaxID=171643 RepID=A0A9Q0XML5_9SAUR|nr:hypothetical protein JRQ81_019399 [Phrynocephalus forsythii]
MKELAEFHYPIFQNTVDTETQREEYIQIVTLPESDYGVTGAQDEAEIKGEIPESTTNPDAVPRCSSRANKELQQSICPTSQGCHKQRSLHHGTKSRSYPQQKQTNGKQQHRRKLVHCKRAKHRLLQNFHLKSHEYGHVQRCKDRLVAKGYFQQSALFDEGPVHLPRDWNGIKGEVFKVYCTIYVKLPSTENPILVGFTDADWAEDIPDQKSTRGSVFFYGGGSTNWISCKQGSIARSSTEAEYISSAAACDEIVWLKLLLADLKVDEPTPITLCEDNQS